MNNKCLSRRVGLGAAAAAVVAAKVLENSTESLWV